MTSPEFVTLAALAEQANMRPFSVKRAVDRMGLDVRQVRTGGRKPQAAVSLTDAELFLHSQNTPGVKPRNADAPKIGGVYLVKPDPILRPNRIKIGWTDNFSGRLQAHRCIAPEIAIMRLYAIDAIWSEQMAIRTLATLGAPVANEIFEIEDHDAALAILDAQFVNIGARILELRQ